MPWPPWLWPGGDSRSSNASHAPAVDLALDAWAAAIETPTDDDESIAAARPPLVPVTQKGTAMKTLMTRSSLAALFAAVALSISGCGGGSGDAGPTGPEGPGGPEGP